MNNTLSNNTNMKIVNNALAAPTVHANGKLDCVLF